MKTHVNPGTTTAKRRRRRAPVVRHVEEGRSVFSSYDFTDPIGIEEFLDGPRSVHAHVAMASLLS